ncbi:hypothetical protein [Metamycoplasma neophronis]|uniref:Uncharacterized protein n=1 Tax=Metamycoplasma neophronis TaxID=872983 RepID=A0ABY2Z078_9BACT|nr:hypothetical protein [Metamycoplasma neophronis]TPR54049.1 hypothetical protein FJR74_01235 [Metamycoplasma neophronis]
MANKKIKAASAFLAVATIASTAGTIYVLLENNNESNDIRKRIAELVSEIKSWSLNNLKNKNYAKELENSVNDGIKKIETILVDKNIKDAATLSKFYDDALKKFEEDKRTLDILENENSATKQALIKANKEFDDFNQANQNNDLVMNTLNHFQDQINNINNSYVVAHNLTDLISVKENANNFSELLEATNQLLKSISLSQETLDKFGNYEHENKNSLQNLTNEAIAAVNDMTLNNENKKSLAEKLNNAANEIGDFLNSEKQSLVAQIYNIIEQAKKYSNDNLKDDIFNNLRNKLTNQIEQITLDLNNANNLGDFNAILVNNKNLISETEQLKNLINDLNEEKIKAENNKNEINSYPDAFEENELEDLVNLINKSDTALETLNSKELITVLNDLSLKNNKLNDYINSLKNKLISSTEALIEEAKEYNNLIDEQKYPTIKKQLEKLISSISEKANNKSLVGELSENKKSLETALKNSKYIIAREKLKDAIKFSKNLLDNIVNNNAFDSNLNLNHIISQAEDVLSATYSQNQDIAKIYNDAINNLSTDFANEIKKQAKIRLQKAKELSKELEDKKYYVNNAISSAKRDLDAAIANLEVSLEENDNENNIVDNVIALNNAFVEAESFKNATAEERLKLLEKIQKTKEKINEIVANLGNEKDELANDNFEKYEKLIEDLTNTIENYENNTKPEMENAGLARLNEIQKQLQDKLDSVPANKAKIDEEYQKQIDILNSNIERAKEILKLMPTDEYNPEKALLQNILAQSEDNHSINSVEKIKAINSKFADILEQANNKATKINNEKTELINDINNLVTVAKNYLDENVNQNPSIRNILETEIQKNSQTETNSISLTKDELNRKISDLSNALERAKKAVENGNNKSVLNEKVNELEELKNSITSLDPTMVDLKNKLQEAIKQANQVLEAENADEYLNQLSKLNEIQTEANKNIQDFATELSNKIQQHETALSEAKDLLANLEKDSNKANLTDVINQLKLAIESNKVIDNNEPLESIAAKTSNLNNAISSAKENKKLADNLTNQKLADLNNTIAESNDLSAKMTDPALESAKVKLDAVISKATNIHDAEIKSTNEVIESSNEELKQAQSEAKLALDKLNKEKADLQDSIRNKAEEIQNYISDSLAEEQYKQIKADLAAVLDNYNKNQKNSLDVKDKASLEDIQTKLNDALDLAKNKKTEVDNQIKKDNKTKLSEKVNALEELKNSITSLDPTMVDLKNKLQEAIKQANQVLEAENADEYLNQLSKLNEIQTEANKNIQDFATELSNKIQQHETALSEAKDLLANLEKDSNKSNLTDVINQLNLAIESNKVIDNNEPLESIATKTSNLNNAISSAKENKKLADNLTNQKLTDLNNTIAESNDLSAKMTDPALESAKAKLDAVISKATNIHDAEIKSINEVIESSNEELKQAQSEAKLALDKLNKEKADLQDSIRNKAEEIQNYISDSLAEEQYKQIKADLAAVLDNYNKNQKNSLDVKDKASLEDIQTKLNDALDLAKNKKTEVDNQIKKDNKTKLSEKVNALEELKNSITSLDPTMVDLKNKLQEAIKQANQVLEAENADEYLNQLSKLNEIQTEANKVISDFSDRLNVAKAEYNKKLAEAKTLSNDIKQSSNSANLVGVDEALNSIIDNNNSINDNDAISLINAKTNALAKAIEKANAAIKENNSLTDQKLAELNNQIEIAEKLLEKMSDPALAEDKQSLNEAIVKAKNTAEANKKQLNNIIDADTQKLIEKIQVAQSALNNLNQENEKLIAKINKENAEVSDFATNLDNILVNTKSESNNYLSELNENTLPLLNQKNNAELKEILKSIEDKKVEIKQNAFNEATNLLSAELKNAKSLKEELNNLPNHEAAEIQDLISKLDKAINNATLANSSSDLTAIVEAFKNLKQINTEAKDAIKNSYKNELNKMFENAKAIKSKHAWTNEKAQEIIDETTPFLTNNDKDFSEYKQAYQNIKPKNEKLNKEIEDWNNQAKLFNDSKETMNSLALAISELAKEQINFNPALNDLLSQANAQSNIVLDNGWTKDELVNKISEMKAKYQEISNALKANQKQKLNEFKAIIGANKVKANDLNSKFSNFDELRTINNKVNNNYDKVIDAINTIDNNSFVYKGNVKNIYDNLLSESEKQIIASLNETLNRINYLRSSALIFNSQLNKNIIDTNSINQQIDNQGNGLSKISNWNELNNLVNGLNNIYSNSIKNSIIDLKNALNYVLNGNNNDFNVAWLNNINSLNNFIAKTSEAFKDNESIIKANNNLKASVAQTQSLDIINQNNLSNSVDQNIKSQLSNINQSSEATESNYLGQSYFEILSAAFKGKENILSEVKNQFNEMMQLVNKNKNEVLGVITDFKNHADDKKTQWPYLSTINSLNAEEIKIQNKDDLFELNSAVNNLTGLIGKNQDKLAEVIKAKVRIVNNYYQYLFTKEMFTIGFTKGDEIKSFKNISPNDINVEYYEITGMSITDGYKGNWYENPQTEQGQGLYQNALNIIIDTLDFNKNKELSAEYSLNANKLNEKINSIEGSEIASVNILKDASLNILKSIQNALFKKIYQNMPNIMQYLPVANSQNNGKLTPSNNYYDYLYEQRNNSSYGRFYTNPVFYDNNNANTANSGSAPTEIIEFNNYLNVMLGAINNYQNKFELNINNTNTNEVYDSLEKFNQLYIIDKRYSSVKDRLSVMYDLILKRLTYDGDLDSAQKNNPFLVNNGYNILINTDNERLKATPYSYMQMVGYTAYVLRNLINKDIAPHLDQKRFGTWMNNDKGEAYVWNPNVQNEVEKVSYRGLLNDVIMRMGVWISDEPDGLSHNGLIDGGPRYGVKWSSGYNNYPDRILYGPWKSYNDGFYSQRQFGTYSFFYNQSTRLSTNINPISGEGVIGTGQGALDWIRNAYQDIYKVIDWLSDFNHPSNPFYKNKFKLYSFNSKNGFASKTNINTSSANPSPISYSKSNNTEWIKNSLIDLDKNIG